MYFTFLFIILLVSIPFGPLSIALSIMHLGFAYPVLENVSPYSKYGLPVVIVVLIFKSFLYLYLRRTRIVGHSTALMLSLATITICGLSTLIWRNFAAFELGLLVTVVIDLAIFSYVKYRDAFVGEAPKIWISALPILWSLMIWLPATIVPREWLRWLEWMDHIMHPIPSALIVGVWIFITAIQIWFSIKHYHMTMTQ